MLSQLSYAPINTVTISATDYILTHSFPDVNSFFDFFYPFLYICRLTRKIHHRFTIFAKKCRDRRPRRSSKTLDIIPVDRRGRRSLQHLSRFALILKVAVFVQAFLFILIISENQHPDAKRQNCHDNHCNGNILTFGRIVFGFGNLADNL